MERVYIDTAIWRDYFEKRKDSKKELGEIAGRFLEKLIKESVVIVFSDIVKRELLHTYAHQELDALFLPFQQNIVEVEACTDDFFEAHALSMEHDVPFGDALHAVLARNHRAHMITRDKDFKRLQNVCPFQKPEDVV
jgi:predicted nucleic acid-binding protein